MKDKIFLLETSFKAIEDEDSIKIEGYASTNDIDRVGDVITADAWTKGGLNNYKKNPIILFNHNYSRPIGKATELSVDEKGLKLTAKISKAAADIAALIKDGVLSTFSVGFRIKDAKYDSLNDIYYINDVELYEVSVVSVPCNQDAVFSLAKSFGSETEYKEFIKDIIVPVGPKAEDSVSAQDSAGEATDKGDVSPVTKEKKMDKEQLDAMEALAKEVAEKTAAALLKQQADEAARLADEKAKKDAEDEKIRIAVTSGAEKLIKDVEDRFRQKEESLETIVNELKEDLTAKAAEIEKIRESKRVFSDRGDKGDWKKAHEQDIVDTYVLGIASGKGWNTKKAKDLITKVNDHSGVEVSSEDFEQIVSTNIERDIQLELILAPMFRELPMTSATMILPIMPDSGYAQFGAGTLAGGTYDDRNATQTPPKGNLDARSATFGDHDGIDLQERVVSTKKLMSTSYLGNETEEDAILPILPLIREGMIRSHARAVEHAILLGNHADGVYGTGGSSFPGLVALAAEDGHKVQPSGSFAVGDAVTAADLFGLRKRMGKYGIRPEDVIFIVSQDVYYNLIEDAEFQDVNLVGDLATKVKGSVGKVYGTNVIVCDEFAAKAASKYNAIAVWTRNYVIPRLRGITLESEYSVKDQRRVLVASQRLGFIDIIDGAATKYALQYKAP